MVGGDRLGNLELQGKKNCVPFLKKQIPDAAPNAYTTLLISSRLLCLCSHANRARPKKLFWKAPYQPSPHLSATFQPHYYEEVRKKRRSTPESKSRLLPSGYMPRFDNHLNLFVANAAEKCGRRLFNLPQAEFVLQKSAKPHRG